jgi:acetyl-CoA C-acetyltransferase
MEGVAKIRSAVPGGVITAGNASQFSDGSSACVLVNAKLAERQGLKPMGAFHGFAVAGCEPDEMGIGPVFAVPELLQRAGLKVEDIGLWELNEAFACQVVSCRDKLGIPDDRRGLSGPRREGLHLIAQSHRLRHHRQGVVRAGRVHLAAG